MKCNRCGKEIDELEIFCDDCKKYLKEFSSRKKVKELEELIEDQRNFDDLENTKELVDLDKIVKEELKKEETIVDKKEIIRQDVKEIAREDNEFIDIEKEEKKKRKIIIIVSIVLSILAIISTLLIIFLGKKEKEEEPKVKIDYEKVINLYGDSAKEVVVDYIEENDDIPTWQYVIENIDYNRYKVECSIHNIYNDGNIYLSSCKVDGNKIKYTYGIEQEETIDGKQINIYKQEYNGFIVYSNDAADSTLIGTITCKTENCDYVNAYKEYVIIKENEEYYLYNYINDKVKFGPFNLKEEYNVLVHDNELYGIIYTEDNQNNIYNVKTNKVLKNIKGYLLPGEMGFDPTIMYKYNYVILINDEKNEFINLKTGNISYFIKEKIISFEECNKLVYITTLTSNNKYKIYNSNGKTLFDGKEYLDFIASSDKFLVSDETNFKVYDNNLKLQTTSKEYSQILALYKDYVIAIKNNNLILLNTKDEILETFENVWNKENNVFYRNLTGEKDNKFIITIENKKIPHGTQGSFIEYYYNLTTKESGFIEKSNID